MIRVGCARTVSEISSYSRVRIAVSSSLQLRHHLASRERVLMLVGGTNGLAKDVGFSTALGVIQGSVHALEHQTVGVPHDEEDEVYL